MRKILLFFVALLGLSIGRASAQKISDVVFDFRDDKVYVTYRAIIPNYYYLTNISLLVSYDGGPFRPITEHVSGDLGIEIRGGQKTIVWDCFAANGHQPIDGRIQFRIDYDYEFSHQYQVQIDQRQKRIDQRRQRLHKPTFFLEYVWSPGVPFGVGMGYGKRWGGYLRAYWNTTQFITPETSDYSNESYENYYPGYDSEKKHLTLSATGGIFFKATTWLRFNAGLGYGQIVDKQEYYLYKGLAYEAGLTVSFFRKKWLGLSVGYRGLVPAPSRLGGVQAGICFNF